MSRDEVALAEEREKDAAALRFIEEVTRKSDEEQNRVLAEILSQNADTEYLKRFGLEGATDRNTFKSKVPVVSYDDIQPFIQRIANGDFSSILCHHPISEFLTSSGTSAGERKLIPITKEEIIERRLPLMSLVMPVIKRDFPGLDRGKGLYFLFIKAETTTPGGLIARPSITSYLKSHSFKNRPYNPYNIYTSPDEAILCPDPFQSMYIHLLCGLYDRLSVLRIGSIFASGLLRAIRFLELHYLDLCHDISTGTLNPNITDPALRACVAKFMNPDPELAGFINKECGSENWEGIIKRIWPNTKYLDVTVTGAMAHYVPTLDYYSGGLPKVCTMYVSSECFFGFNLNPLCHPSEVSYTLFPNMAYFEFIPLDETSDCDDSMPQLVDLADVKIGKDYELVVTTYAGLYRYRMGDALRVTGFHNTSPKMKFVRRNKVLLSIDSDKTNEVDLQKAIESASALLKPYQTSIIDYTSYADIKTIPGHYVIYLELLTKDSINNGPSDEVLDQCCLAMEESLSSVYRQCRVADQSIGPLEIRVVKNGTFQELMDLAISRGASINQYKVPRCVSVMPMVNLLDSRVVSRHFSCSMPHWNP